jgi:hypothetical protein
MTRAKRSEIIHSIRAKYSEPCSVERVYQFDYTLPTLIIVSTSANPLFRRYTKVVEVLVTGRPRSQPLHRVLGWIHHLCMTPEPFEVVVGTGRLRQNMNHKIPIIHQNPIGGVISFNADRQFTDSFQPLSDLIGNSVPLPLVRHRAYKEKIREGGDGAEVKNSNINRAFRFRGSGRNQPVRYFLEGRNRMKIYRTVCQILKALSCAQITTGSASRA